MSPAEDGIHVVTGAFGYSVRYIAERLLNGGKRVRTLARSLKNAISRDACDVDSATMVS